MLSFVFSIDNPVTYHWSGKFTSPSSEWIHSTRQLNDYELFLVTEGTLYIADSHNKFEVKKEEYLLMPPTQKQYGYAPSDCSFFWLHFIVSPSEEDIHNKIILPQHNSIPNIERIIILFNQLCDADRRYHHPYTNDTFLTGFLLELYNQLQTGHREKAISSKTALYHSILDYIYFNKYTKIKVVQLADYFGYHEKYLSTVFKNIAGISLKQYILQQTMEFAKAELMDTNKTISQIGYSFGYTDSHNFSNAFKSAVGVTPTEYRISCSKIPKTPYSFCLIELVLSKSVKFMKNQKYRDNAALVVIYSGTNCS